MRLHSFDSLELVQESHRLDFRSNYQGAKITISTAVAVNLPRPNYNYVLLFLLMHCVFMPLIATSTNVVIECTTGGY